MLPVSDPVWICEPMIGILLSVESTRSCCAARVVLEHEPEDRHEYEQQREEREERVVGDQRREVAGLVVAELLDHGDRKRGDAVAPLKSVEGLQRGERIHALRSIRNARVADRCGRVVSTSERSEVQAELAGQLLRPDVELGEAAAEDEDAHRDQDAAADADDRAVVALDHGEGRGRAGEGERRDQKRDREAERVDGEQERAMQRLALNSREGEDAAQRRAGAGRPGDRERRAGDDRAALAGAGEQRIDMPLAVEPVDE